MNKFRVTLLGALWASFFCCLSAFAQGNILYTWHGNSSYFQASFQVTPEENQPGQYFEFGPLKSTFSVVSPAHEYLPSSASLVGEDASGFGPPLFLSITLADTFSGTGIHAISRNGTSVMWEYQLSDNLILKMEPGSWTSAPIPEPSFSLLTLSIAVWVLWARRLSGPKPTLHTSTRFARSVRFAQSPVHSVHVGPCQPMSPQLNLAIQPKVLYKLITS